MVTKLKAAAVHFLPMLIHHYDRYKKDGLIEPRDVQKATLQYRESLDAVKEFIDENLTKDEDGAISWTDFNARYRKVTKKTRKREDVWAELRKHGMDYKDTTRNGETFRGFLGWKWITSAQ